MSDEFVAQPVPQSALDRLEETGRALAERRAAEGAPAPTIVMRGTGEPGKYAGLVPDAVLLDDVDRVVIVRSPDDLQANAVLVDAIPAPPDTPAAPAEPAEPAEPAWLAGADDEERRELEALGVVAAPDTSDAAAMDAQVSLQLRRVRECERELARYSAAELREHEAIARRYATLRAPTESLRDRLGAFIRYAATVVPFGKKARSRKVGWGLYGLRRNPEKVEEADGDALVRSVRAVAAAVPTTEAPDHVLVSVELTLRQLDAVREALSASDVTLALAEAFADTRVEFFTRAAQRKALAAVEGVEGLRVIPAEDRPYFEASDPTGGDDD